MRLTRFLVRKGDDLKGYWYLSVDGDKHRLSIRDPRTGDKTVKDYRRPELTVLEFEKSYLQYVVDEVAALAEAAKRLPDTEFQRPGFRKGWLSRLRAQIEQERKERLNKGRKEFYENLAKLKENGWPLPEPPPLPWESVDATKAALSSQPSLRPLGLGRVPYEGRRRTCEPAFPFRLFARPAQSSSGDGTGSENQPTESLPAATSHAPHTEVQSGEDVRLGSVPVGGSGAVVSGDRGEVSASLLPGSEVVKAAGVRTEEAILTGGGATGAVSARDVGSGSSQEVLKKLLDYSRLARVSQCTDPFAKLVHEARLRASAVQALKGAVQESLTRFADRKAALSFGQRIWDNPAADPADCQEGGGSVGQGGPA